MKSIFLKHLHEGYTQRKYDLNKSRIEKFIDDFFRFVFFLELQRCSSENEMNNRLIGFKKDFTEILQSVFDTPEEAAKTAEYFFEKFPEVYVTLEKDAEFLLQNDPAATSLEEITFSYPGFYATAIYRFAHELYLKQIPIIPRIWTELAHSKTGIDIHPGATIGSPFFIDHGTGIVIGETSFIGNFVKFYQGVTLGALSVSKEIANTKRHPTIKDHVVIYANATVLGGETVIGEDSIIGGNVWITESLPANSVVFHKGQVTIKQKYPTEEPINYFI